MVLKEKKLLGPELVTTIPIVLEDANDKFLVNEKSDFKKSTPFFINMDLKEVT
jgi:hypothetical protein